MPTNKPLQLSALTLAMAALLSGCGSMPKSQALLDAEQAYANAKSDPKVLQHASKELNRAEEALSRARGTESPEEMNTYAYVSERRTGVAQAVTEKKLAQEELDRLSQEKGRVQLEMRELETAQARAERESAQRERAEALREREFALAEREKALAEARKLQQELEALQAEKTARGMVMTLGDVLFATDKADLLPGAMDTINRLAEFMQQYPDKRLLIEGHTDSVGSEEYNQRLSERRALSVKDALVSRGVAPQRIRTTGLGESRPVASNDTEAGRLKNRRVEIVIQD